MGIQTAKEQASGPDDIKGLTFHTYPGLAHSASPQEVTALNTWLKLVVPGDR